MAKVRTEFSRKSTRQQALESSDKDKIYFPTDAPTIITGGREFGGITAEDKATLALVKGLQEGGVQGLTLGAMFLEEQEMEGLTAGNTVGAILYFGLEESEDASEPATYNATTGKLTIPDATYNATTGKLTVPSATYSSTTCKITLN